jgi:aryl-alcohol dehydrogenase-like predicted oxidoreductase
VDPLIVHSVRLTNVRFCDPAHSSHINFFQVGGLLDYTTLGKTGLRVSVAGLGCGGNSRLGLGAGKSMPEAAKVVRAAIDLGVNYFDTARNYGTEPAVGAAIKDVRRDNVVISTKSTINVDGVRLTAEQLIANLDNSLKQLDTDYIDVYMLHGVRPADYDYSLETLAPAMLKERDKGKFRHLGITETAPRDPTQQMLQRAVSEPCWEVVMLAYHMMNQGARMHVFPKSRENGVGTLLMFVVRNIFSKPGLLEKTVKDLVQNGDLPADFPDQDDPLGFLIHDGGAASVIDAAYRFARHQPGADVVLFGTGNPDHLLSNINSILKPPLPDADVGKLHTLFGGLTGVGLDSPDNMPKP